MTLHALGGLAGSLQALLQQRAACGRHVIQKSYLSIDAYLLEEQSRQISSESD